ncbi:Abi family protein [Kribbella sp. C-35]|uniref:Abi family protein n=1 Tax=Kribbella sp. C-35 TaxID=2789276 RepID=UPI00397D8B3B
MLPYTKPHLSFDDQVQLLKSRGMVVDDPAAAAELLSVVGYYRLSGYGYPYRRQLGNRQRDDQFVAGTNFSTVVRLYDADRRLKLHVLDDVERVEILDLGSAAHLYRGLKAVDRTAIAQDLDIVDGLGRGNGHTLGNWLRVLNYVRNICAHHSRLWNRHMVNKIGARQLATIPELQHLSAPEVSHHRIYSTLCVLAFLLQRIGQGDWASGVRELITVEIPACGRGLSEMGFPAGWEGRWPWM